MAEGTINVNTQYGTQINDCNDAIVPGISYWVNDSASNKPTGGWWQINCLNSQNSDYKTQIASTLNPSIYKPTFYMRTSKVDNNNVKSWEPWQLIYTLKFIYTGDDLNNYYGINRSGFYYVSASQGSVSNCPIGWCGLLVIMTEDGGGVQLVFAENGLYIRNRSGIPLAWTAWKKVTLTSA